MMSIDIKLHPISYETMTMLTNFAKQGFGECKHLCYILPDTMRLLITLSDYALADKLDLSIINQIANSRAP